MMTILDIEQKKKRIKTQREYKKSESKNHLFFKHFARK